MIPIERRVIYVWLFIILAITSILYWNSIGWLRFGMIWFEIATLVIGILYIELSSKTGRTRK